LGVIAAAFDAGCDCALIPIKGMKSLTLQRLSHADKISNPSGMQIKSRFLKS
jgi:hypothetical protein